MHYGTAHQHAIHHGRQHQCLAYYGTQDWYIEDVLGDRRFDTVHSLSIVSLSMTMVTFIVLLHCVTVLQKHPCHLLPRSEQVTRFLLCEGHTQAGISTKLRMGQSDVCPCQIPQR